MITEEELDVIKEMERWREQQNIRHDENSRGGGMAESSLCREKVGTKLS